MKAHHRNLARLADELGLIVRHTRRGHVHLLDATTGRLVASCSSTPGDRTVALACARRDARRRLAELNPTKGIAR